MELARQTPYAADDPSPAPRGNFDRINTRALGTFLQSDGKFDEERVT
jgi:hypothetical protein